MYFALLDDFYDLIILFFLNYYLKCNCKWWIINDILILLLIPILPFSSSFFSSRKLFFSIFSQRSVIIIPSFPFSHSPCILPTLYLSLYPAFFLFSSHLSFLPAYYSFILPSPFLWYIILFSSNSYNSLVKQLVHSNQSTWHFKKQLSKFKPLKGLDIHMTRQKYTKTI